MRVSASSLNAVDERSTARVCVCVEGQPGHGAGASWAGISAAGSRDGGLLGGDDVDASALQDKGRGAVRVEEVAAQEGEAAVLAQVEGSGAGKGPLERGAGALDADSADGGVVEVQRDLVVVEGKGRQLVELLNGEGVGAGFGVEQADVVEHGEGAGRDWGGADGGAGVVLDAEAEGDDLELEVVGHGGEFSGAAGDGQRRVGHGRTAGNISLFYGRAESQSRRGEDKKRLAEHLVGRRIDEWWWCN